LTPIFKIGEKCRKTLELKAFPVDFWQVWRKSIPFWFLKTQSLDFLFESALLDSTFQPSWLRFCKLPHDSKLFAHFVVIEHTIQTKNKNE